MSEGQWIGFALVVTALAVVLLAIAGLYLGSVLSRVADALEALRPPSPVRLQPPNAGTGGRPLSPPRPAPQPAPVARWP